MGPEHCFSETPAYLLAAVRRYAAYRKASNACARPVAIVPRAAHRPSFGAPSLQRPEFAVRADTTVVAVPSTRPLPRRGARGSP